MPSGAKMPDLVQHIPRNPFGNGEANYTNTIPGPKMQKQTNPFVKAHLLRTASRLLWLLAVCAIPFGHAQGSTVLYDQLNNLGSYGTDSDDFWDLPAWSSFTADDFVVPQGRTWTITEVDAQ